MLEVRNWMKKNVRTIGPRDTVAHARDLMTRERINQLPVVARGKLVGIVTDRDLVVRGLAEEGVDTLTLADVCSADLTTVAPDADPRAVIKLMSDRAVRRVPVVEDGRPVGIVSLGDLAARLDEQSVLGQISSAPPDA